MKKIITLILSLCLSCILCSCGVSQADFDSATKRIVELEGQVSALEQRVAVLEATPNPTPTPTPTVAPTATPIPAPEISKSDENLRVMIEGSYITTYSSQEEAKAHPITVTPYYVSNYRKGIQFEISGITLEKVEMTGEPFYVDNIPYFSGRETLDFEYTGEVYHLEYKQVPTITSDRCIEVVSINGAIKYFYIQINENK